MLRKVFISCLFIFVAASPVIFAKENTVRQQIERWGTFELSLNGPQNGTPFIDVQLTARFECNGRVVEAGGFYDGDGTYRIRFMPDAIGEWKYTTKSNCDQFNGKTGQFICIKSSTDNHGPVRIRDTHHFAYADGTAYFPFGTTSYSWCHQDPALQQQTLATLKSSPFNKLRMAVFPLNFRYTKNEPPYYPFERTSDGKWDFTRFNPVFFRNIEQRVLDLQKLGIEADIILFHPYDYDRWGFSEMDSATDERYLRYVIARFAAYRNVWWSVANEFDMLKNKNMTDWDKFFQIINSIDPYQHLRSIHNAEIFYDYAKPSVTHVTIQSPDLTQAQQLREKYKKPVIFDECQYEGNIDDVWGNLSPQELVHRFWFGVTQGCYVGHSEAYLHPQDIMWWSKGGVLHGQSPSRIAFLKKIVEDSPTEGFEPIGDSWTWRFVTGGKKNNCQLIYFGVHQPSRWPFDLGKDRRYKVDIINTWQMTITPIEKIFNGKFEIELPGRPYMAVRVRAVK